MVQQIVSKCQKYPNIFLQGYHLVKILAQYQSATVQFVMALYRNWNYHNWNFPPICLKLEVLAHKLPSISKGFCGVPRTG